MRLLFPTTVRRRPAVLAALAAAVILLPVAWYLGSPLFIDQAVDEAFPVEARVAAGPVSVATTTPAVAVAAVIAPTATLIPPTTPVSPAATTVPTIVSSVPASATPAPSPTITAASAASPTAAAVPVLAAAPATAIQRSAILPMPTPLPAPAPAWPPVPVPTATPTLAPARPAATATPVPPTATPLPAPPATPVPPATPPASAGPVALRRGQFTRIDALHWAEGTATVYQFPDGQRLLRLEPFKAGNGPGLYVYLSGHPMPRSSAQLHQAGAVELAPLKGNVGNQNYTLPPDLDLAAFRSVVIYCKPFSVIFSTATLA